MNALYAEYLLLPVRERELEHARSLARIRAVLRTVADIDQLVDLGAGTQHRLVGATSGAGAPTHLQDNRARNPRIVRTVDAGRQFTRCGCMEI